MTYLEDVAIDGLPSWLFEVVGSLGVDAAALVHIIWEHVNETGTFSVELRDGLMDKLAGLGY